MKATSFFTPGGKYKTAAFGGTVGSLKVASFKDGIPGGKNPAGRAFKIGGKTMKPKSGPSVSK